jgi:DNA-binding XRE family transcriptional regulator
MTRDQTTSPQVPAGAEQQSTSGVVVSPVLVLSQEFAARPASIPDAHLFVRETLAAADVEPAPHAAVTEAINTALLAAASPDIGAFVVVIRLFPGEAEIEVLSAADVITTSAPVLETAGGGSFAEWLSEALRKEGLSQEAAARQLGVSVRTVSRWVRGQTEPRLRDVRRISDVFGPVPHR